MNTCLRETDDDNNGEVTSGLPAFRGPLPTLQPSGPAQSSHLALLNPVSNPPISPQPPMSRRVLLDRGIPSPIVWRHRHMHLERARTSCGWGAELVLVHDSFHATSEPAKHGRMPDSRFRTPLRLLGRPPPHARCTGCGVDMTVACHHHLGPSCAWRGYVCLGCHVIMTMVCCHDRGLWWKGAT